MMADAIKAQQELVKQLWAENDRAVDRLLAFQSERDMDTFDVFDLELLELGDACDDTRSAAHKAMEVLMGMEERTSS